MVKDKEMEVEENKEEQEGAEISALELEVRQACALFFATLQKISYVYGINPKQTEELAEKWIEAVNKNK